jgi:DNA-binding PadR family transcriptional regulator
MLSFLARGSGYGYGIAEQLAEQGLDVEKTIVYRALRGLERDGNATSRWVASHHGPQRRLYSLTAAGRRTLDSLAAVVLDNRRAYQGFVETYARPARRQDAEQHQVQTPEDGASRREPDLLVGWLLLLLDGGLTYGYDLRRHLGEHHVDAAAGVAYRLLGRMDADGRVQSRWSEPIDGPRRHLYTVTADGRAHLRRIAPAITHARDVYDAFVEGYEDLDHDYPRPPR